MAEVTFCEECNNILYARSDRKNKKLIYVCRSCEFISHKQNEEHNVVARINYNYNRKEDIYIHPETKNDPALGRVRDWKCKQCGNNEAVFLQLPEKISYNPMALIYVCTDKSCHYWEKEIQQKSDNLYKSDESSVSSQDNDSKLSIKEEISGDAIYGEKKNNVNNGTNRKNRKKLKKKKDEEDEDEEEEYQLKQELYKILNINEKEYNEEIKLKNENLYDLNVEEYFCE
ncbi:DNA-directed RNA polymerase 2, putative [Plasmodium gallinaceum]|uniref:DNA-directed RNA polymerase 2, putative n=1 Tax=Plasmodium gallinaceum TaxID=5849 RepID=A0A1J1GM91_PLAGA|nr:DNA-directed RNA polymerase 2, putative [Plasmodium gallinaceum]CRG93357.1 DNA-directed RNA polymerase 2, putative [Plasmodium gallinaceum]